MHSTRFVRLAAVAGATLSLALTACTSNTTAGSGSVSVGAASASAGGSGGLTAVTISTIGLTADAAISLGSDQGYFKDEGLQISTRTVPNPPAGISAVQSGQITLAYAPSIPVLTALSNGIGLKVVAAADGYEDGATTKKDAAARDDTAVYVDPAAGVSRPKDLTGKKVAIPARKAQLEVTIAQVVKNDGGDPSQINWVVLDFPSAVAALKARRVDAAGLVTPFTSQAKSNGAKLLSSPGLAFFQKGAVGLWVTSSKQAQDTELMQKLQRAIYKSNAYANSHLDQAQQRAAEITKVDLSVIKSAANPYWPTTVREEDVRRADKQLADLGYIPKPVDLNGVILPQP